MKSDWCPTTVNFTNAPSSLSVSTVIMVLLTTATAASWLWSVVYDTEGADVWKGIRVAVQHLLDGMSGSDELIR